MDDEEVKSVCIIQNTSLSPYLSGQMGLVEESDYPLDRLTSTLYVHHAAARDVGEYSCVATAGGAGSRPIHGYSPFKISKVK